MAELPQEGQMLLAMKSPSTSVPSNGEEEVFHGQESQQKKGPTWVKCCHPPLLRSCPTLGLPVIALPEGGEAEVGKPRLLLPSQHTICLEEYQTPVFTQVEYSAWGLHLPFSFFSAERVKKLSASDSLGCWGLVVFIFLSSAICANCYFMHMKHTTSSLSSLVWSESLARVENNKQKLTCFLPSLMSIPASNYLEY